MRRTNPQLALGRCGQGPIWEPTGSTDAWLFSLITMGSLFVPVLGAISLTLVVVSLAFVEVPTESEE